MTVRLLYVRQVGNLILKERSGETVRTEKLPKWTVWTVNGEFVEEFRRRDVAIRYLNKHS